MKPQPSFPAYSEIDTLTGTGESAYIDKSQNIKTNGEFPRRKLPYRPRATRKPIIYIASPYTKGDPGINTHWQCKMFEEFMNDGIIIPVMPLWTHFQHIVHPRPYEDWIAYDNALIPLYDGCFRGIVDIPELGYYQKESSGADAEVAYYLGTYKPVFYNKPDMYEWITEFWKEYLEEIENKA